jgi:Uma2 family endonuclease
MLPPKMNDSLLEPLLRSPLLPEQVEQLNRVLTIEQQRRREFYEEMTEQGSWEFINGEVMRGQPLTHAHLRILGRLRRILSIWVTLKKLGQVGGPKTLCQFPRNDYEPDIVFFGIAKAALLQPDTLLHPVPDFVVEVLSPSTSSSNRGLKLQDYQAHGVQEYWIIDPEAETVEQFILEGTHYSQGKRLCDGLITSQAVAGFEISVRAIFDDVRNLSELRRLLDINR